MLEQMFERLSIETSSYCRRRCATCLRQTYPDRDALKPWFSQNLMPTELVYNLLDQAAAMGFAGTVCLSYYNEPTFDKRLPEFGEYAMRLGFARVTVATTGDTLDEDMAKRLDGCFHDLSVSLYENSNEENKDRIRSLFQKTHIRFTNGLHVHLHLSPTSKYGSFRCFNVSRNMVINHRGDFLACCQEIIPHFDLGSAHDTPLADLWDAKRHLRERLLRHGGRMEHPYCAMCSYGGVKEYVEVASV